MLHKRLTSLIFFLSGFSFTDTDDSQYSKGTEGTIFYFTLPLPPAHEYWEIYLQLCMWDDYHVFLIATLVFTRLLLGEIYHLVELPFDWLIDWLIDYLMMQCLFVYLMNWFQVFVTAILRWEPGEFELSSTITLVLQANRLTKCASHPKYQVYLLSSISIIKISSISIIKLYPIKLYLNIVKSNKNLSREFARNVKLH